jgi:TolB protein
MMSRRLRSLALLLCCLALGPTVAPQDPQQPPPPESGAPPAEGEKGPADVTITLDPSKVRTRVRIALPAMTRLEGMSAGAREAATLLEKALLDDLEYSGVFDVQDQEILSVLELTGDRAQDFPMYRGLGNQVILLGELSEQSGRLIVEARVLDLENFGSICQGKRYRGTFEQARRIGHTYADEVVACFTGTPGIALTSIAFASNRTGHKEIFLMDYDGLDQRPLSGHQSISMAPAWSPPGDGLAYVSYFTGHPSIYWVELANGEKRPIVEDGLHNFTPTFSPDGQWVAFTRSLRGNAEIFKVNRRGGEPVQLTNNAKIDANPAWSPNGREIAFTSDRAGTPQIYIMDADGGNVRRVSRDGLSNDGAAWHPEGSRIAYAHRREGGQRFDIAVTDLATEETRLLTSAPGSNEAPAFSPDGRHIVFESTRDGSSQIWVIDVDGGNLRRLTAQGESFAPAWSGRPAS